MNKWWKSPVLQGPENDYGEYDYLIEEVPSNTEKWSWYFEKCDECGKEHYLNLGFTGYFRTMDGYDSVYTCECWKCYFKRKITTPFKRAKRKLKKHLYTKRRVCELNKEYKQVVGKSLPKERRQSLYNILMKEC